VLRAGLGAVHDGVATVELEWVIEVGKTLGGLAVTRVGNPTEGLHEHGRSKVVVRVPPVGWAGCGATGAENALVHAVELLPVLRGLKVLIAVRCRASHVSRGELGVGLEPRLDGFVLVVEVTHVRDKILGERKTRNQHMRGGRGAYSICRRSRIKEEKATVCVDSP